MKHCEAWAKQVEPWAAIRLPEPPNLPRKVGRLDFLLIAQTTVDTDGSLGANLTTSFEYDGLNRNVLTRDPNGETTQFEYDAFGQLLSLTDAAGNMTSYQYDLRGLPSLVVDPHGNESSRTFDGNGNLIEKTDRNGRTTTYTYDALNRLTDESWLNTNGVAENAILHAYDDAGNLATTANGDVTYDYQYDQLDRPTVVSRHDVGITSAILRTDYEYDLAGNAVSREASSLDTQLAFTDSFSFDRLNRPVEIERSSSATPVDLRATYAYDSVGNVDRLVRSQRESSTFEDVVDSVFAQDGANRLREIAFSIDNSNSLATFGYDFDAASRISETVDPIANERYGYDLAGQLTSVDELAANGTTYVGSEDYQYGENGNRISTTADGTTSNYETGTGNRTSSDGTYTYSYDDEGNRISRIQTGSPNEYTNYEWDSNSRWNT